MSQHVDFKVGGYVSLNGFAPGKDADVILEGTYDTGGQFGAYYDVTLYVDLELETISCVEFQVG